MPDDKLTLQLTILGTQFQPACPKLCEDIHVTISRDEVSFEMERIRF